MTDRPQCPRPTGWGHCPFRGSSPAGVIPAAVRPVQGCISAPGSSLPVVYFRCPVGQAGGRACRTVPLPRALCPVVVSLPLVGAAVPSMQGRQPIAAGPTLHSRATEQQGTAASVPPCWPVTHGADAPIPNARSIPAAVVANRPQWPTTGQPRGEHSSEMDKTRMTPHTGEACARPATTGPPQSTPLQEGANRARRGPQGVTPPPTRQAGSSARPESVPTHIGHSRCAVGGGARW